MKVKFFYTLAVLFFWGGSLSSAAWSAGSLDGKTFTGEMGNQGEVKGTSDDFVFQNGKFKSALCTQFGYGEGDYQATVQGNVVDFQAKTASEKGGTMDWKGEVKGDVIEGNAVTHENGKDSESWFKGALKK